MYVTREQMFLFCALIVAIIGLVIEIINTINKKR